MHETVCAGNTTVSTFKWQHKHFYLPNFITKFKAEEVKNATSSHMIEVFGGNASNENKFKPMPPVC